MRGGFWGIPRHNLNDRRTLGGGHTSASRRVLGRVAALARVRLETEGLCPRVRELDAERGGGVVLSHGRGPSRSLRGLGLPCGQEHGRSKQPQRQQTESRGDYVLPPAVGVAQEREADPPLTVERPKDARNSVELLSDLGPQALRRHADALGLAKGHRPPGTTGLAIAILKLVGFPVPTTPTFTFHAQLASSERAAEMLPLSRDEEELRGRFKTGADAVEQAVRLAARAWVTVAQPDAVDDTIEALFRQARDDKAYKGVGKFTLGDWVAVFGKLTPDVLTHPPAPHLHAGLARVRRALTKGTVQQYVDTHVGHRNTIEHPESHTLGYRSMPK
jgi:hypothetical protein